jgi:hypothetical protein
LGEWIGGAGWTSFLFREPWASIEVRLYKVVNVLQKLGSAICYASRALKKTNKDAMENTEYNFYII